MKDKREIEGVGGEKKRREGVEKETRSDVEELFKSRIRVKEVRAKLKEPSKNSIRITVCIICHYRERCGATNSRQ